MFQVSLLSFPFPFESFSCHSFIADLLALISYGSLSSENIFVLLSFPEDLLLGHRIRG